MLAESLVAFTFDPCMPSLSILSLASVPLVQLNVLDLAFLPLFRHHVSSALATADYLRCLMIELSKAFDVVENYHRQLSF